MRKKLGNYQSNHIRTYLKWGTYVILAVGLGGCSFLPKEEAVLAPPLVEPAQLDYETVEVKKGEIIKWVKGSGNLIPTSHHDLHYTVDGGRLKKVHVKEGDLVEKGQTLAEIETGNLAFDIEQTKIELQKAQIRLKQMKEENADKYSLQIAQLDIDGIQKRIAFMNEQLANSKIISPINGIITFVSEIKQGQMVPAYESIFQVAETSQLQVLYTAVNAADLNEVNIGMEAKLSIGGEDLKGEVVQTPAEVPKDVAEKNPELYSKSLLIKPESLPKDVKVGDLAGIEVVTDKKENTIVIPKNALRKTVGREYVQIIEENSKREADVEVGIISSTEVEVLKGLEEGDVIILR